MNGLNPDLLAGALRVARLSVEKMGFVPSDAAAGGGQAPPDPAAGGGAPPPPDPSAGGGAPPPPAPADPSMGQPPPGPGASDPSSIAGQVAMGVQQGMAGSGLMGNKGMGPNGKPAVKPDINTIATDVFQLKKMLFAIMRHAQIELPPDVLDGPNRDPQTGAPAESPTGGSDVQPGASMQQPPSSISPISPIQGAFPGGGGAGGGAGGGMGSMGGGGAPGGGMGKRSNDQAHQIGSRVHQSVTGDSVLSKAAAVALLCRRRREVA